MTDNEITKALECCKGEAVSCSECIYADFGQCQTYMADDALKLINRQKDVINQQAETIKIIEQALIDKTAEIERLRKRIKEISKENYTSTTL